MEALYKVPGEAVEPNVDEAQVSTAFRASWRIPLRRASTKAKTRLGLRELFSSSWSTMNAKRRDMIWLYYLPPEPNDSLNYIHTGLLAQGEK